MCKIEDMDLKGDIGGYDRVNSGDLEDWYNIITCCLSMCVSVFVCVCSWIWLTKNNFLEEFLENLSIVFVSFCQLDTMQGSSGLKEPQMNKCLHHNCL